MSELEQKIQKDFLDSLKTGQQLRRLVLSMLTSALKDRQLVKRGQLSKTVSDVSELEEKSRLNDEEIIETVQSEAKKRKESIEQFEAASRTELAGKEKDELEILLDYLPRQMSEEEVRRAALEIITEMSVKDVKEAGRAIGALVAKFKARIDGKLAGQIVIQELNKLL